MAQKFEDTKTALSTENVDKTMEATETDDRINEENSIKVQDDNSELMNRETIELDSNKMNGTINVKTIEQNDTNVLSTKSINSKLNPNHLQDKTRGFLRSEMKQSTERINEPDAASKINSEFYMDDEYTEHFLPRLVDTSDVIGEMVQVIFQTFWKYLCPLLAYKDIRMNNLAWIVCPSSILLIHIHNASTIIVNVNS